MNQNDLKEAYTSIAMTEHQNREVLFAGTSGCGWLKRCGSATQTLEC